MTTAEVKAANWTAEEEAVIAKYVAGGMNRSNAIRKMRAMQLKGEVRREWLTSNLPGNNYQAYVALLGLRLQR